MNKVIAAIDCSQAAAPVLGMAAVMAPTLGAEVEALYVGDDAGVTARESAARSGVAFCQLPGDPLERICEAAEQDDTVAVAIGARRIRTGHMGHLAEQVADRVDKPVLVVPPDAELPATLRTVVIAMEGTPRKARSLRAAVTLAATTDLELVVVHVDDEGSIPSFSDQTAHETDAYAAEFLARYLKGAPEARLELRIGVPADEIIAAADDAHAQLLAIGWPRAHRLHGAVARELLERSHLPVLLVALEDDDEGEGR